jgi:hypothetical protein
MEELAYTQKRSMELYVFPFTSAMALFIHSLIRVIITVSILNGFGALT